MERIVAVLLALAALIAACVLMVAGRNAQALVTAVLFVGLVLASAGLPNLSRRP